MQKTYKKVLVLCTGNSCRSIIAEALINANIAEVTAHSSGVKPSKNVNINAKKVLTHNKIWNDSYHSKDLSSIEHIDFDLVITVCDNAKENCPIFPKNTKVIHIGFVDPDGKEYKEFEITYDEIRKRLLPIVKKELSI